MIPQSKAPNSSACNCFNKVAIKIFSLGHPVPHSWSFSLNRLHTPRKCSPPLANPPSKPALKINIYKRLPCHLVPHSYTSTNGVSNPAGLVRLRRAGRPQPHPRRILTEGFQGYMYETGVGVLFRFETGWNLSLLRNKSFWDKVKVSALVLRPSNV